MANKKSENIFQTPEGVWFRVREEESTQHNITIVGGRRNVCSKKSKHVQKNHRIRTIEIGCFDTKTVERFNDIQINDSSLQPIRKLQKGFLYAILFKIFSSK